MNLFLDCEFNGFGGELISMALIDESGHYFYEVLPCVEPTDWVAANVMPLLDKDAICLNEFQIKLGKFLNHYTYINIIADWPEDLALFSRVLIVSAGRCMLTPPITMKLWMDDGQVHIPSSIPHHALSDAIALAQSYKYR